MSKINITTTIHKSLDMFSYFIANDEKEREHLYHMIYDWTTEKYLIIQIESNRIIERLNSICELENKFKNYKMVDVDIQIK